MDNNYDLKIDKLGVVSPEYQDGAIYDSHIYRFGPHGNCEVISLENMRVVSRFMLDKSDEVMTHSNSVCFYEADGELYLYTNVYNSYQNEEDKREGVCCVYKMSGTHEAPESRLVQIIKIGFTGKKGVWISENKKDIRTYGNFTVDKENKKLYAFTMLDEEHVTRYFEFDLPTIKAEGEIETVVLQESDIITQFDSSYSYYIQGATFASGYLFSVEGFNTPALPPALRIINVKEQKAALEINLMADHGLVHEPEYIDVYNNEIYFADNKGNYYKFTITR